MVGREAERDAMWRALRKVTDDKRPRVLLLEGPSGFGKTHLANWFAQRANEVGAADVLRASHDPDDSTGDALLRMASDHLRVRGLSQAQVESRLSRLVQGRASK